jgi:metal-sulfur cluster biosynthetic enzyme
MKSPLSLLDMGMVRAFSIDRLGVVHITMTTTSPFCILVAAIMQSVEERLLAVPGVRAVDITLDHSSVWTEALMSDEGRAKLEARRRESLRLVPVRPRQWKEGPLVKRGGG